MKAFIKHYLLTLLLCLLVCIGFSQNHAFKQYTTGNGLPTNEVYSTIQDSKGYLLLGTENGVLRFDGEDFQQISFSSKKYNNITVFDLFKDKENRIWAKSFHNGLFFLEKGKFKPYRFNNKILQVVKNTFIDKVVIGSQGSVWFTMGSKANTYYEISENGTLKKIAKNNLPHSLVSIIYTLGKNDKLIVNTKYKAPLKNSIKNSCKWQVTTFNNNKLIRNYLCHQDTFSLTRAGYYIETDNYYYISINNILLKFDLDNNLLEKKKFNKTILNLFLDKNSNLLISTYGGAYVHFALTGEYKSMLRNKIVSHIYQDYDGGYWFSTVNQGLFYLPSFNMYTLKDYNIFKEELNTIGGNSKYFIASDIKKNIYVYTKAGNKFTFYKKFISYNKKYYPKNIIIENDTIFLGASFINLKTDKEQLVFNEGKQIVKQFFINKADTSMVFIVTSGLVKLNYLTKKRANIFYDNSKIFTHVLNYENNYYLGSSNGLFTYNSTHGLKQIFSEHITLKVRDIQLLNKHNIVVSTKGQGIFIINGEKITQLNKNHSLSSESCTKIVIQNDNTFWVASNFGLNRVILKNNKTVINTLFSSDGLKSNFIQDLVMLDSTLMILTKSGINYIDINSYKTNKRKLSSLALKINNKTVTYYDTVIINPTSRNISLTTNVVNLGKIPNLKYSFTLQGEGIELREKSESQSVNFNKLEPGKYTLFINALVSGNKLLSQSVKYNIEVIPLFYERSWFKASIYILSILILLALIIYYFFKRERNRKREHYYNRLQLEALSLQMSPHFLFNALNSVLYLSTKNQYRTLNKFISKLSTMLRSTLNNSLISLIPLKQELENTINYIEMEQFRFGEDTFLYEIEIDEQLNLKALKVPPILLQPIVENAIWHGLLQTNTERKLKLSIKTILNGFTIQIHDNGIGFSTKSIKKNNSKIKKSLGIKNVKRRLELYTKMNFGKATLQVLSRDQQQQGTLVSILFTPKI